VKQKNGFAGLIFPLVLVLSLCGCATSLLKGVTPEGEKVYAGLVPIDGTEAYQEYVKSPRSGVNRIHYLMRRLKETKDLEYYRDGSYYNWLQAYRGGMWLMRHRYQKGQSARDFIRLHVWRSESTGKPHLVRFPDGSIHIGYYILMNELDLLDDTMQKNEALS